MEARPALVTAADYLKAEASSPIRHEFVAGSVYAKSDACRSHALITRALSGVLYRETATGHLLVSPDHQHVMYATRLPSKERGKGEWEAHPGCWEFVKR